ncbi:succinyl-diaminopimelate desuccinylase [Halorubrum californiense DSM 19288]|uniref:Succinyl-diaminopimelate desuccinylase n=1 Tax=Halorubrum californiense DSM 19288 TaxID=1227465 RepID=M0EK61_9EURY|nr:MULTISPECIES: M20/M25/M40 family metallo-hydrolase [Halorubrum]ELZ48161.1 succinyl-diaminopimelate desuccinylase [Halorubrum californiense DSM 19288]TKX72565.1 M20/M25/M40 family metallo-hydrolase [Halorubrum sp. GN11GM_10-3_MGM]
MSDGSDAAPGRPDDFDPVSFLEDAVQIPSHESVDEMREFVVDLLDDRSADPAVAADGCVLAEKRSPAPEDGPHLVLNTHFDTVTPHVPFERGEAADERGGSAEAPDGPDGASEVIRGRGACDAKGPLAALLAGFLAADPDRGQITLALTPDEEELSLGAAALTGRLPGTDDRLDGDLFLVGEPTGLDACTAAKGRFQATVELSGTAAHAAEFAGANAVAAAEDALGAVRTFDADADEHPQLGPPKLTPTVIGGGAATNQVPADCSITVDRRSVPPETAEEFRSSLAAAVRESLADGAGGDHGDVDAAVGLTDRESPFLEAFATDPDHELVRIVAGAAREAADAAGLPSERGGSARPFGAATEASYFAPAPTVVFGPGDLADESGAVAHAEREYVRVREVEAAAAAVRDAVSALVGGAETTGTDDAV